MILRPAGEARRYTERKASVKWSRSAVLAVIAIFAVSYGYSTIERIQLSNEVQEEERASCAKEGSFDCDLVAKYHDECFGQSYRAEYRIRSFHADEYRVCIEDKIAKHLDLKRE